MREKKYSAEEGILFSELFGRGMYALHPKDTYVFAADPERILSSRILRNILTEERYYVRRENTGHPLLYYESLIRRPADNRCVLWPVDITAYAPETGSTLYTANHYSEKKIQPDEGLDWGLLFPADPVSREGCDRILEQMPEKNWKQDPVRHLAARIIRSLARINKEGYLYFDFHFSRFLADASDGELLLDFSGLIFPAGGEPYACNPAPGTIPVEFIHPDLALGKTRTWALWQQNYSLTAMLFYLFIGRYAYDGRLLEGYPDDTMQNHYIKFRDYHKMPVFIFDEEDRSNNLGRFSSEQRTITLWEELPAAIRTVFAEVLCVRTGEAHQAAAEAMTPDRWLTLLAEYNL